MYFILTAKSLLWVTLSIVSTITLFTAIYSPKWLIGPTDYNCLSSKLLSAETNNTVDSPYYEVRCRPSVGIYYRCKKINGNQHCGSFAVEGLSTDSAMFPFVWKIGLVLMSAGVFVSFLMSALAVVSFCKQSISKKSVFGIAGSGTRTRRFTLFDWCNLFRRWLGFGTRCDAVRNSIRAFCFCGLYEWIRFVHCSFWYCSHFRHCHVVGASGPSNV
ncbi:unnamed protein product [Aphis gossypii]|uniref:Lipoma HMGIC fusion partner-like 2 protein n=1 Tax=Aphis gossypii TaxID=80765 RepID=A0A9P0IKY9_APHGO|nr:unnamed protein product [Aphis gossypii]